MNDTQSSDLGSLALGDLLMQRRSLRRTLAAGDGLQPIRIAVMSGSTPSELINLWELWLLEAGFAPVFHTPDYGRYYVDSVHDTEALVSFRPDIVFVHTGVHDIQQLPPLQTTSAELGAAVEHEIARFRQIWTSIAEKLGCTVIQNNFELPPHALFGNLDAILPCGRTRFVQELNREFTLTAERDSKVLIHDVCSLSARVGLDRWFDSKRWFSYKIITTAEANRALAVSLSSMVRALYGKTKKLLVLDLDNTLWGGVIGDDGLDKIQIGRETPMAEAYTAFQEYCLSLRNRGILLAVCSKNNEEIALKGFEHPDTILKRKHFAAFKANWEPKHENIEQIARELGLGTDSFVFVDDNPAERTLVAAQVRGIAVPDVGDDVSRYPQILDAGRYFETVSLSQEDLARSAQYAENAARNAFEAKFADYGEYLDSLEMTAEIDYFRPVYLERIAQLTNKTNQFNLTTRRYTQAEMENLDGDQNYVGLYGKLSDRFGDHGLISVVLGHHAGSTLEMDLWLMSCRVLKRGMESAMLDELVARAWDRGIRTIVGTYLPTGKNGMVAEFYPSLGFRPAFDLNALLPEGATAWRLELAGYFAQNKHIKVQESTHVQSHA